MATVIIPPVLNGAGDLVPAILDVRLVLANGSSAIGFVATDLVTEYQNTTIPEEGVTLTLTPQSDIALEDGAATYYAISIRTQYKEQTYTVQVADAVEDQLLSALVAASTIDPADILALYLVPSGGTTFQVLAKASADDYDVTWVDPDSGGAVSIQSGNYPLTASDSVVVFTATATATLPAATGSGHTYRIVCRAGTLTIDADGSETIKGELTATLSAGEDLILTDTETGVWE